MSLMSPPLLETFTFWDVIWWMVVAYFFMMALFIFISIVGDIFRRNDIGGVIKACWLIFIFILPLLGALLYMLMRPAMTEQDRQLMEQAQAQAQRSAGYSATEEIARAQALLSSGAITAAEFETLKAKALR